MAEVWEQALGTGRCTFGRAQVRVQELKKEINIPNKLDLIINIQIAFNRTFP